MPTPTQSGVNKCDYGNDYPTNTHTPSPDSAGAPLSSRPPADDATPNWSPAPLVCKQNIQDGGAHASRGDGHCSLGADDSSTPPVLVCMVDARLTTAPSIHTLHTANNTTVFSATTTAHSGVIGDSDKGRAPVTHNGPHLEAYYKAHSGHTLEPHTDVLCIDSDDNLPHKAIAATGGIHTHHSYTVTPVAHAGDAHTSPTATLEEHETPTGAGETHSPLPQFIAHMDYPHRAPPQEHPGEPNVEEEHTALPALEETPTTVKAGQNHAFNSYHNWPFPDYTFPDSRAKLYDLVRSHNMPNWKGAKVALKSTLNIKQWELESTGHTLDEQVLTGVMYGYPMQYTGGPRYDCNVVSNHPSAAHHTTHVEAYLQEETAMGALVGPFTRPPFTPWMNVSPMMTREKTGTTKRRLIVDLSYPDGGINQFIIKNNYHGNKVQHNLPTVPQALKVITELGRDDLYLAVMDLSRAYRHFLVDPINWPLLVVKQDGRYYVDTALPFGAVMSSYIMQQAAEFIIRALKTKGVTALMYLDDLLIISRSKERADTDYNTAGDLFTRLGLTVAQNKCQPPAHIATWLGICINIPKNEISIPPLKLEEISTSLAHLSSYTTISIKQLQQAIGRIAHLAKAVPPAKLFMRRLLAALRGAGHGPIQVTRSIQADLNWFKRFLNQYNGRSIIPSPDVHLTIWADACMRGGGATDGTNCYMHTFPDKFREGKNINHFEALNCVAAARRFSNGIKPGTVIQVCCDNMASVDAFRGLRPKDAILAAGARALWYLSARRQLEIRFIHVPGVLMKIADALSRACLSDRAAAKACDIITENDLHLVRIDHASYNVSGFF